jgi:hypothetical protein
MMSPIGRLYRDEEIEEIMVSGELLHTLNKLRQKKTGFTLAGDLTDCRSKA